MLLAAGCGSTVSQNGGASQVESEVRDGFASQKNAIVRDASCSETTDADHFSCDLTYETPEGLAQTATVMVACDADRCVWRES